MSLRYIGFEQFLNKRLYKFECQATGYPATHLVVSADLTLFSAHGVNIQDGPTLCAQRLAAVPVVPQQKYLELTDQEFRSHAARQAFAEQEKAVARRRLHNRLPARRPRSLLSGHWG